MDYSTFSSNNFFIKKDSTLPEIKFPLTEKIREKYDITENMLESVAVTVSMIDDNGMYRIANREANLVINNDRVNFPDEEKYTLMYRFRLKDTRKAGNYRFEYCLDFLTPGECGKIKFPINGYVNVIISDALTKTSVV